MFGMILSCDWYVIEDKFRMIGFVFLNWKNYLNCLLSYIEIKNHFPLVGPVRHGLQVFNNFYLSLVNPFNTGKKGGTASKQDAFEKIYCQLDRLCILKRAKAQAQILVGLQRLDLSH